MTVCKKCGSTAAESRLFAGAQALLDAVEHVLIASEDGGDMNDIDWDLLRRAVKGATEGGE